MKKSLHFTMLLLLAFKTSFCCINGETKVLKNGTIISMDEPGDIIPYGHNFFEHNYDEELKQLDRLWRSTGNIDYLSDYGIVLILQKEYTKAKDVYLRIERIKPGRYSTAANLGTVYELLGQNKDALTWIQKAIAIDPHSHKSSEWLHAKIIEAKIKGDQYITSNFLLNTSFGTKPQPESKLTDTALLQLRDALYYQLNERVSFIKPQDKIVAQLLFDLGNICMLTNEKNAAVIIYNMAGDYGFRDPILQQRLDIANDTKKKTPAPAALPPKAGNYTAWQLFWFIPLLAAIAIILRRKNKKTRPGTA